MRSLTVPLPQTIQAPRTTSSRREIQKYKAVKHRQFAPVVDRPEPLWRVHHEISYRHLTCQDEGHRSGKQTKQKKKSAEKFKYARHKR